MTDTRRLSAEMREEIKARPIKNAELCDALHDLDIADAERDEALAAFAAARDTASQMEEERDEAIEHHEAAVELYRQTHAELAQAQATIEAKNLALKCAYRYNDEDKATIAQQGAVIAAMREALDAWFSGDSWDSVKERLDLAIQNAAQLAADHDAAIRAEERRRVLEEVGVKWMPITEDAPQEEWVLLWFVGKQKDDMPPPTPGIAYGLISAYEEDKVWNGETYRPLEFFTHWMSLRGIRALKDQPAEIERHIEQLAAQPEEAKG